MVLLLTVRPQNLIIQIITEIMQNASRQQHLCQLFLQRRQKPLKGEQQRGEQARWDMDLLCTSKGFKSCFSSVHASSKFHLQKLKIWFSCI